MYFDETINIIEIFLNKEPCEFSSKFNSFSHSAFD